MVSRYHGVFRNQKNAPGKTGQKGRPGTTGPPGGGGGGGPTFENPQMEFIIGDGINLITAGLFPTAVTSVPRNRTIQGWTLLSCDAAAPISGAIVLDIWVAPYSTYPPTVANTIIPSGTKPTIAASATKAQYVNLTGWSRNLSTGDIVFINVDSVTSFKAVKLILDIA